MIRVPKHPSLGVLKTVTAATGTGHIIGPATSNMARSGIGQVGRKVIETVMLIRAVITLTTGTLDNIKEHKERYQLPSKIL
jgi:hypothetical protein